MDLFLFHINNLDFLFFFINLSIEQQQHPHEFKCFVLIKCFGTMYKY